MKTLPWKRKNKKIIEMIRICRESGKPLLILGTSIFSLIFQCSVEFRNFEFFNIPINMFEKAKNMDSKSFFNHFCDKEESIKGFNKLFKN